MKTCGHQCCKLRGYECEPCKETKTNKIAKIMDNSTYTVVKELKIKNQNLNTTVQKLDSDYNSLLENYAKIVKENEQIRKAQKNAFMVLQESKFKSNKLFAENIQAVIDKLYQYE